MPKTRYFCIAKMSIILLMVSLIPNTVFGQNDRDTAPRGIRLKKRNASPNGKSMAILIGVNNYIAASKLQYCVQDVVLSADALRASGQFEDLYLIHDDRKSNAWTPTLGNISRQLRNLLNLANEQGYQRVLVYFSGHGYRDNKMQKLYLAPQDCDPSNISGTALPIADLKAWLDRCTQVDVKLLILDCCHAGETKSTTGTGVPSDVMAESFRTCRGLLTLASCRDEEVSLEWKAKSQGLFSYWFCKGLNGAADLNGDLIVDSNEIHDYTYAKVLKTSVTELNRRQTVVRRPSNDWQGVAPIVRLKKPYVSDEQPQRIAMDSRWRPAIARIAEKLSTRLGELGENELVVGNFSPGFQSSDSTGGVGLAKMLVEQLAEQGIATSRTAKLGIEGRYTIQAKQLDDYRAVVLNLTITLLNQDGEELGRFPETVNALGEALNPDRPANGGQTTVTDADGATSISSTAGLTVSLPVDLSTGLVGRHEALSQALSPLRRVHLEETQVFAAPGRPYSIEVLVDNKPLQPSERQGQAFVKLAAEESYTVRVTNQSSEAAAVSLFIDGLSVFAFSENKSYRNFIVPAGKSFEIPGWHRTNQRSDSFLVKSYGDNTWSASLKNPASIGTITATFAAAWKPGQKPADEELSSLGQRGGAETVLGPPRVTRYRNVNRVVGMMRDSITVRYSF